MFFLYGFGSACTNLFAQEETTIDGRDVWFFDDTETLRKEWSSANFESVGELYVDVFFESNAILTPCFTA